jgi:hypothetical protein
MLGIGRMRIVRRRLLKMVLFCVVAVLNISWYGLRYLINVFDILTGMIPFHWIEESLVDVGMQIWFCIMTLYVQVEHTFYVI